MNREVETESLEKSIFKTLGNQKRRDILRFVGEKKQVTFTEIKRDFKLKAALAVLPSCSLAFFIAQKSAR